MRRRAREVEKAHEGRCAAESFSEHDSFFDKKAGELTGKKAKSSRILLVRKESPVKGRGRFGNTDLKGGPNGPAGEGNCQGEKSS